MNVSLVLLPLVWLTAEDARYAELRFPPHPRLATTAAELTKQRSEPGFAQLEQRTVRAAEAHLKSPVEVPQGWGNWSFYYACPDDAATLQPLSVAEHRCPRCQKVFTDERTVAAYRTLLHDRANDAALQLAWAYAYTGDRRFAQAVQRILLQLADDYPRYPARQDRWGHVGILALRGGRRYSQSLDEAVGVIQLAKAYDLTCDSDLWTDDQRRHVEQDFFRATAKTLLVANWDINNHQTWYNAGLMALASALGDSELLRKVLTMRGGFHDQLQRSLGQDGVWYEGTLAYHHYALQAMIEIADAGRRLGLSLHQEPALRRMLEAPLSMAYPNGQFPALNDSDPAGISSFSASFRWGWEALQDERFAQASAAGNLTRLQSLLGPQAVVRPYLATDSQNLADIGLAILRRGSGTDAACVVLDHGPHGGSHGHYDKLGIVVFAAGQEWLLDPGRLTYSHAEYQTWVKQTVAHNTVVLGQTSQMGTKGKLLWFESNERFSACGAECDSAYLGSMLRRYLLLTDGLLVDLFQVATPQPTQIDYPVHVVSTAVQPVGEVPSGVEVVPGQRQGYEHLTAARSWSLANSTWDFLAREPRRLRVWFAAAAPEQVIACTGIGYQREQKVPCLLRRINGDQAQFATAYDLTATGSGITSFRAETDGLLIVSTPQGEFQVRFRPDGVQCSLRDKPPSKSNRR